MIWPVGRCRLHGICSPKKIRAMNTSQICSALNRLVVILARSLPAYLADAKPWRQYGEDDAVPVLSAIVADQEEMVDRLADHIMDLGGTVDRGAFPMQFTDMHDLSLDYGLARMLEQQADDVLMIEAEVKRLAAAPVSRELAEETLGMAKGHLDNLSDLVKKLPSAG